MKKTLIASLLLAAYASPASAYVCGGLDKIEIPAVQVEAVGADSADLPLLPASGEVALFKNYTGFGKFHYSPPFSISFTMTAKRLDNGKILYTSVPTQVSIKGAIRPLPPFSCHDQVNSIEFKINTQDSADAKKDRTLAVGSFSIPVGSGAKSVSFPTGVQTIRLQPARSVEGSVTAKIGAEESEFKSDATYELTTAEGKKVLLRPDRSALSQAEVQLLETSLSTGAKLTLRGALTDSSEPLLDVSSITQ